MGFYVLIHVAFACDNNDDIAPHAKKHLKLLPEDAPLECQWFLDELSERSGPNPGPKGGLSLWGMVGNYTNVQKFTKALMPFWKDILQSASSPLAFEKIVVFGETEAQSNCVAYVVGLVKQKRLTEYYLSLEKVEVQRIKLK